MKKKISENKGPSHFTGCTVIAVADGRNYVTIKELLDSKCTSVEVYSEAINNVITIKTLKIIPSTQIKRVFTIRFTSGESMKVTEDYLFHLKKGEVVTFKKLRKGSSLRVIARYKNTRTSGLLNRDTRLFGGLPSLTVASIVEEEMEEVFTIEVEPYNNFFIGNFRGKISGSRNQGTSVKIGN